MKPNSTECEEILEQYTDWLLKKGFVDADVYAECDAVGDFLKTIEPISSRHENGHQSKEKCVVDPEFRKQYEDAHATPTIVNEGRSSR